MAHVEGKSAVVHQHDFIFSLYALLKPIIKEVIILRSILSFDQIAEHLIRHEMDSYKYLGQHQYKVMNT